MSAFDEFIERREREKRWHHGIQRYITVGRKADDLRAVWDLARSHRISRWLRPERAEAACRDVEHAWQRGAVTGWIIRTAPPPDGTVGESV